MGHPMLPQTERLGQLLMQLMTKARMSSHLQLRTRSWSLAVLWKLEGEWFVDEAAAELEKK